MLYSTQKVSKKMIRSLLISNCMQLKYNIEYTTFLGLKLFMGVLGVKI